MGKNKKSIVLLVLSFTCFLSSVFAKSNKVESIQVENMNSWQEEFDLDSRKPGKYNIMITAKDLGGNTYVEGPYNLWVDPKSDLPLCGITNPYPNMRVVGNLNIVGTCVDDDGVSKVELILDEGTEYEKKVVAEGKEFWSYYLDTTNLEEGPHTIRVIGYDINDEPRVNNSKMDNSILTWQLDRKQPLTEVLEREMGMLVSGNVKFIGTVSDGNGIKELSYSVDGGKLFKDIKLSKTKDPSVCNFNISVDTKKFADGPAVLWFKAVDQAGSVGLYSFLYFIDNTKPDVQIISPAEGEVVNGKFTVAGFAKDKIGVTALSWTCGSESGELELIPGNPYWSVELNTIDSKDKNKTFKVKAIDKVGNIVEVARTIPLNQENDKPVVTAVEPVEGQSYDDSERMIVRGIVHDDDSVKAVKIQLDGNEPVIQETKGSYYLDLGSVKDIGFGKHKITITGIDENDVPGNPIVTNVESKGAAPKFADASIVCGKETIPFVNGIAVHPESNSVFNLPVTSEAGIKSVHTELTWGTDGVISNDVELKNVSSYTTVIPVNYDSPKGNVRISVKVTDSIDRVSEYKAGIYITNTSVVKSDEIQLIFSDSTIAEDGTVVLSPDYPLSGYVLGGTAKKVEFVPDTKFAMVKLVDNCIQIIPGNEAGKSEPVYIRVTTDKGKVKTSSIPFTFVADTVIPELTLDGISDENAIDGRNGAVKITGKAKCETGLGSVKYRILSAKAELKNTVISAFKSDAIPEEFESVKVAGDGSFEIEVDSSAFEPGMYVVEIIAESAGGAQYNSAAAAISIIPEIEEINGKLAPAGAPKFALLDGVDSYIVAALQAPLNRNFQRFPRSEMNEGKNDIFMTVSGDDGKEIPAKFSVNKNYTLDAYIASVNGENYLSGKVVTLPYAAKDGGKISVTIKSALPVSSVAYEFSGEEIPGGDVIQSGSVKAVKSVDDPLKWNADISLSNLPSRVNNFTVSIKAGTLEKTIKGSIIVVRENSDVDDSEGIVEYAEADTIFNEAENFYTLKNGSRFFYYANFASPITASVNEPGVGIEVDGKNIILKAVKDGYYRDVVVTVKDGLGDTYTSKPLNFLADSAVPEVHIQTPELHQWLGNSVKISGTATDVNGITGIQYSIDGGENWNDAKIITSGAGNIGVTFNETVDLSAFEDGLVRIDVKVTDRAGQVSYDYTSAYKDVTPPEVKVVVPLSADVVNGQNLIVFDAKDTAKVNKAEYAAPPSAKAGSTEIPLASLVTTFVGTDSMPIDDSMSFTFTDDAGNKTTIESWDFIIDNESDKPRCEIHVPEEMQVITRDFTISGVVYDDDGDTEIYYKIDNGSFKKLPQMGTSFAIDIPLSMMTDNEHTVTVYAVDINGVKGDETTKTFRISLEEPKGAVELPKIETSVREIVTISGWASDKNGISKVQISLDNGNSFNDANGTEEWSYTVDTRAIPGGTQVVFLKVTDNYGIQGLYSSLINIDNNAPVLNLELPLDDSITTGSLFFSGNIYDNVDVTDLYVTIRNLEKTSKADVRPMKIDRIIGQTLDITNLENGFYNVELTGKDKAGNVSNVSRNIHLDKSLPPADVNILYPLNGEHKQGVFTIYGEAKGEKAISYLRLYLDGEIVSETNLTYSNFFKFDLGPDLITEGAHTYKVDAVFADGKYVSSVEQVIFYNPIGPWVTIDNFTYGDFATGRPYIKGRAGYSVDQDEVLFAKTKEATDEFKAAVAAKKVQKVELSFDNGKTFTEVSKGEKWMYRIENTDLEEGYHFLLVRASMQNGENAVTRTIIQIDNTSPTVKLIAPSNGGRYNQKLQVSGLSGDDVKIEDVTVTLRQGDKASYEVPSFIQGLYLDFHLWGATLFDVGAGFTFFDDNVKLQVQWGQYTQDQRNAVSAILGKPQTEMRYGGDSVVGMKILANVASIPFSYFFGHDFDWLSASATIGAQFTRFNKTNSGEAQILSALLAQLEFPKAKFSSNKMFSTWSLYTEGSLWFIPTDVKGSDIENLIPQIAIGIRTNVF